MKQLIFLLPILFFQTVHLSIVDDFEEKNPQGEVLFRVIDGNRLKVINSHHQERWALKWSLGGAKVAAVKSTSRSTWHFNLTDGSTAVLEYLERSTTNNVTEFTFNWIGGMQNINREVCFHIGYNDASWYGTSQTKHPGFPINSKLTYAKTPVVLGYSKTEVEGILEHLYLNSNGFALYLNPQMPLFLRASANEDDPIRCISVNNTGPYNQNALKTSYFDITFRLFTSTNIRTVYDYILQHSKLIGTPKSLPDEATFTYPTWFAFENGSAMSSPAQVIEFPTTIAHHNFPAAGRLLLSQDSSLSFNTTQFPHPEEMVATVNRLGFKLALTEDGRLRTPNSHLKQELILKGTQNVIDFSNSQAVEYYDLLLRKLHYEIGVDNFWSVPFEFERFQQQEEKVVLKFTDENIQDYPNLFIKQYIETLAKNDREITTFSAYQTQHLPVIVSLLPTNGNLSLLIADALTVSLAGYSFITANTELFGLPKEVVEETYIRQIQATTFFPVMTLARPPWEISQKALEITQNCVNLHQQYGAKFRSLAKERQTSGAPILRPMWFDHADDAETYHISDQFMLGGDLLVAPILQIGKIERSVYLPAGEWIDQHGKAWNGPKTIKVAAPLDVLPYFKRKV